MHSIRGRPGDVPVSPSTTKGGVRMRSLRMIVTAVLAGALMLALAACGSSSKSSTSANAGSPLPAGVQTPVNESLTGGKRGGVLNEVQSEDFEHLDSGQSYFQLDYQITSATQ